MRSTSSTGRVQFVCGVFPITSTSKAFWTFWFWQLQQTPPPHHTTLRIRANLWILQVSNLLLTRNQAAKDIKWSCSPVCHVSFVLSAQSPDSQSGLKLESFSGLWNWWLWAQLWNHFLDLGVPQGKNCSWQCVCCQMLVSRNPEIQIQTPKKTEIETSEQPRTNTFLYPGVRKYIKIEARNLCQIKENQSLGPKVSFLVLPGAHVNICYQKC